MVWCHRHSEQHQVVTLFWCCEPGECFYSCAEKIERWQASNFREHWNVTTSKYLQAVLGIIASTRMQCTGSWGELSQTRLGRIPQMPLQWMATNHHGTSYDGILLRSLTGHQIRLWHAVNVSPMMKVQASWGHSATTESSGTMLTGRQQVGVARPQWRLRQEAGCHRQIQMFRHYSKRCLKQLSLEHFFRESVPTKELGKKRQQSHTQYGTAVTGHDEWVR